MRWLNWKIKMKTIKVKQTEDGEAYLDLEDFANMVDISKVKKYTLEPTQDAETGDICLVLTFYNSKGKVVGVKK